MVKVIDIQPTPNPDALKFIVNARLTDKGAKVFDDRRTGEKDPLAKALFDVGPVAGIFVLDRFVTVTKFYAAEWPELQGKLAETIEANAQPVEAPAAAGGAGGNDVMARINQVLDENIRPALANDGGGLEIVGFEGNVLSIRYQGACGGCPSSTSGTLNAIQNLLQRLVDENIRVEPV
jgi:NFU1 iron-sulfur cluster scaffold homolog, mitochondrial